MNVAHVIDNHRLAFHVRRVGAQHRGDSLSSRLVFACWTVLQAGQCFRVPLRHHLTFRPICHRHGCGLVHSTSGACRVSHGGLRADYDSQCFRTSHIGHHSHAAVYAGYCYSAAVQLSTGSVVLGSGVGRTAHPAANVLLGWPGGCSRNVGLAACSVCCGAQAPCYGSVAIMQPNYPAKRTRKSVRRLSQALGS